MFKRLTIFAVLLAGCETQTTTPSRIVKFDDVFVGYAPIENECEWQEADIPVFNQKNQRVSFRHRFCDSNNKLINYHFSDGEYGPKIMRKLSMPRVEIVKKMDPTLSDRFEFSLPVFAISKLGSSTPQSYLQSQQQYDERLDFSVCNIKHIGENLWAFENPAFVDLSAEYESRKSTKSYLTKHKEQFRLNQKCANMEFYNFAFKDGIVVRVFSPENYYNIYIDPASITYTNHG